MLASFVVLLSAVLAFKRNQQALFALYWSFVLVLLMAFAIEGVEAAYQISSKPSDSMIYHKAFNSAFSEITQHLFYQYPLALKLLVYPFDSAYLALIAQYALLFIVLISILGHSNVLVTSFIILNHTVIYTGANFLKDNLFLIVTLGTTSLLVKIKTPVLASLLILSSIVLAGTFRPFALLFLPLSFIPFMFGPIRTGVKVIFWLIAMTSLSAILITQWPLIMYVIKSWSSDASVGTTGFSIASLPKILLGPTPFHYFYHESHFVQPLHDVHAWVMTLLHFIFYLFLAIFTLPMLKLFPVYLRNATSNYASLYSLGLGAGTMVVYMLAYGSADIRQRAVILTLILVSFFIALQRNERQIWETISIPVSVFLFLLFTTVSVLAL